MNLPEIFQYSFMLRAMLVAGVLGVIAPWIGSYVVMRRYAPIADTLAHVSLLGIALGYMAHVHPLLAALVTTVTASIWIERTRASRSSFSEVLLSIFLSGSLAGFLVIIQISKSININMTNYFFGSITTVTATDVLIVLLLSTCVALGLVWYRRELFAVVYDEENAQTSGLNTSMLNIGLLIATSTVITLSIPITGTMLIGALMIIPVASATAFRQGFFKTQTLSIVLSQVAVWIGIFVSFYFGISSGASIVICSIIIYLVCNLVGRE